MATVKWQGGAADVAQVTTITFSAYTSGETYTVTVNSKDVSFTATASTLANVIDGLVTALEATDEAEFTEFTPTNDSGLVLTAVTPGVPFTVTASATSGITATVTETTAPTGPNFFDNADNWEGGSVPSAGDDLVFENSDVSLLYALEDTTNYGDLTFDSTYTGNVGLPARNANVYQEYRPRFLKLGDGTSAFAVTIGQGTGRQSSRIFIDGNDATLTLTVYDSGSSNDGEHAVVIKNTDSSSTGDIYGGSVKIDADTSGSLADLRITPLSSFGASQVQTSSSVAAGAVVTSGGNLEIRGSATSVDASGGANVTIANAATCPTVKAASGATVLWQSTANVTTKIFAYNAGVIDFSPNGAAKTVADADCYQGGTIRDPLGVVTWTNGIALPGTRLEDVTLDIGRDKTVTPS